MSGSERKSPLFKRPSVVKELEMYERLKIIGGMTLLEAAAQMELLWTKDLNYDKRFRKAVIKAIQARGAPDPRKESDKAL